MSSPGRGDPCLTYPVLGGASGEVPLRTSLGVGGAFGPVVPSGGIDVPTSAVPGMLTPPMPNCALACSATCLCVA